MNQLMNTPLHIACKWGRVEIIDFLLSTGKVDTKKANACLKTPLHLACVNDDKEVVKVFITYGQIDLTVKDNYGRTAFDVAKILIPIGYTVSSIHRVSAKVSS